MNLGERIVGCSAAPPRPDAYLCPSARGVPGCGEVRKARDCGARRGSLFVDEERRTRRQPARVSAESGQEAK